MELIIKKQLVSRLSRLVHVTRVGTLILIRPTWRFGFRTFSKKDQEELSKWVQEHNYKDASGKPFQPNDYRFKQSFYIKPY